MVARGVTSATTKIRPLITQTYKMLLTYGTKQQEPAVWPPALAILLKESPQIKRYFSSMAVRSLAARWRLSGSLSRATMRWRTETESGSPCSPSSKAWRSRSS